ncbi:hypothetical protein BEWA_022510 [Theileria equi strain WA]|uniref:Chromatin assembly factor 1 subunit A dimerization domain-containing protein n=1 Tax=Theileria equi strain WA TaxID=1537102 RepID=L0AW08_THEEQ|nr:hypothetical protein BEWA_022510 [Theileria equi strain WA]AFZ79403.1 hypothetical protein BEWA_022510 [Theileria equi strain WA]|eukprot:XP_004829069.1 hypothetical protein BEWA_022510 [Theileria equi strain WA]
MDDNADKTTPKTLKSEGPENSTNSNTDGSGKYEPSPEDLEKVKDLEDQISQIINAGIQDTSILRNPEQCTAVWEYVQQHSEGQTDELDDFGVDARLKSIVRAFGEGSTLTLTDLVPRLNEAIRKHSNCAVIDNQLMKLVPIFLIRKNLGDPHMNSSGITRSECKRPECLWVWESPTQDVFSLQLLESVRSARETRNMISRRYKALLKLKNSILSGNTQGQQAATETLNTIDRKMLLDKEKKERAEAKKKSAEVKREGKPEKRERREKENVEKAKKSATANMLLSWLKVPGESKDGVPSRSSGTISVDGTDQEKEELKKIVDSLDCAESEFSTLCEHHRNVWMRYFTYMASRRRFYIEYPNETKNIVTDVPANIEQTSYGCTSLKQERHARTFHMFDTEWKRPPMRLAICKRSSVVTSKTPLEIESALDYGCDSDDEWFEKYDVDVIGDEEEEEEESEEEEADEWIVQDNPQEREFGTGVFDGASESVKVYCMYNNWHWIVDGNPLQSQEVSSKKVASENGMNIMPSEFGFGFEGYTRNPVLDLGTMKGNKITLSRQDVEELLKFCHGKHTSKELLISDFKELKPFASLAEIKAKFKKYMHRVKIDDTPHRWLVTPEATKLFGIRKHLDKILTEQLDRDYMQVF